MGRLESVNQRTIVCNRVSRMDIRVAGRNFVIVGGTQGWVTLRLASWRRRARMSRVLTRDLEHTRDKAEVLAREFGVKAIGIAVDGTELNAVVRGAIDQAAHDLGPLGGLAVTAGPIKQQGAFHEHEDDS